MQAKGRRGRVRQRPPRGIAVSPFSLHLTFLIARHISAILTSIIAAHINQVPCFLLHRDVHQRRWRNAFLLPIMSRSSALDLKSMTSGTVSLSLGTAREETISLIVLYSAPNTAAQHGQLHVNNIKVMVCGRALFSCFANVFDGQVGTPTQLRPMESRTLFTDSLIKFTLAYPPTVKHDFAVAKYAPAVSFVLFDGHAQPTGCALVGCAR